MDICLILPIKKIMETNYQLGTSICPQCDSDFIQEGITQGFCSEDCRKKHFDLMNGVNGIVNRVYVQQLSQEELYEIIHSIPVPMDKIETDLEIPKGTISKALKGLRPFPKRYTWKLEHYRNYGEAPTITPPKMPTVMKVKEATIVIGENSIIISF